MDGMESFLTVLMDVCGVLIKVHFIGQSDVEVFETVHYLHRLMCMGSCWLVLLRMSNMSSFVFVTLRRR